MKPEMKESIKAWLGCLIWILAALLLYKGCDWYSSYSKEKDHQAYIEKKRNDSIRKAYISDSLARDPHYQDSIQKERLRLKKWQEEQSVIDKSTLIGFVVDGDSVYHYSLHTLGVEKDHSYGFSIFDRTRIKFYTYEEIKRLGLSLCSICNEMDDIYYQYSNQELIPIENAKDYGFIQIDEAEEYCGHRISEPLDDSDKY